jgi:hypothetical protein
MKRATHCPVGAPGAPGEQPRCGTAAHTAPPAYLWSWVILRTSHDNVTLPTMTVRELIDRLAQFDPDLEVGLVTEWEGPESLPVRHVELRETSPEDEIAGRQHVRLSRSLL